jgi:hypothetical protein
LIAGLPDQSATVWVEPPLSARVAPLKIASVVRSNRLLGAGDVSDTSVAADVVKRLPPLSAKSAGSP